MSNVYCVYFNRTLLALGCHVGMGDEKAEENLKRTKLPKTWAATCYTYGIWVWYHVILYHFNNKCHSCVFERFTYPSHHNVLLVSYMQSNGYKPAPLDLNHVKLTPNQNTLVERLAENGHNVWARDRVRQGWTYSIVQVSTSLCAKMLWQWVIKTFQCLVFNWFRFNFSWTFFK